MSYLSCVLAFSPSCSSIQGTAPHPHQLTHCPLPDTRTRPGPLQGFRKQRQSRNLRQFWSCSESAHVLPESDMQPWPHSTGPSLQDWRDPGFEAEGLLPQEELWRLSWGGGRCLGGANFQISPGHTLTPGEEPQDVCRGGSGLPAVGSKLQAAPTDPASGATEGDGLLSLAREVSRGGGRRGLTGGTRLGVLWRTLTPLAS